MKYFIIAHIRSYGVPLDLCIDVRLCVYTATLLRQLYTIFIISFESVQKHREDVNDSTTNCELKKKSKMYYVVYLIHPRKYIVVPCHWVRDGETTVLEKFVDRGLNSNQKHLVFWSRERGHVQPNFSANIANEFPCRELEACFMCFILKYKCKSFEF